MNNYSSSSTNDPQPSQGATGSPNPGQQGGPQYNANGAWQKPTQTFNANASAASQPSANTNRPAAGAGQQAPGVNQQSQPQQPQQPQSANQASSPYESPYGTPTSSYSFDGYIGGQGAGNPGNGQYQQSQGNPQPNYSAPAAQPYAGQYQPYTPSYQTQPNTAANGGYVPYVPVESNRWNTLCIVGFVLSFIFAPVGLVLSIIAMNQINKTGEQSKGLSIAGIVISAIGTVSLIIVVVLIVVAISMAGDSSYSDDDDCYYDEDCSSEQTYLDTDHGIQASTQDTADLIWAKPSMLSGADGNVAETLYLQTTGLSQWL
ncbi:DUF4190 domain-containing protein [Bifidobacterium sp. ESL0790]|uniref:DUF4190 domain-containing protein n=1 Tax=Bifidobacterium sp. ESL0790 TaxID=2983233 RepID=UPI0023F75191|nr:DUF4190 domain-containing protein [Bifidobacterium sp. ESL0790]WEV72038.1 DUF4190 domain-containing protein [Bifidobacterium sp. ESL0790]